MMENNRKEWKNANEKEVRLADIIWNIVFEWRKIIICAVVFGLILGAVKYARDLKNYSNTQKNQITQDKEAIEEKLSEEELAGILKAEELTKMLEEKELYRENSIKMNLDAYAENVVALQYYVDTHYTYNLTEDVAPDNVNEIVATYVACVEDNGMQKKLSENLDWNVDGIYITELVSAYYRSGSNTFTIYAAGENKEKAEELAAAVEELINDYQLIVSEAIKEHDLILIDKYSSEIIDEELAKDQNDLKDFIMNNSANLATAIAAFSEDQRAVWDGYVDETLNEKDAEPEEAIAKPGISKKYIFVGAFCGIFLYCIWNVIRYLFGASLKTADELQQLFHLHIFGKLSEEQETKKFLQAIDCWLDSLRTRDALSADEAWGMNLTNLKMTCQKEGVENVFVISTIEMTEKDNELLERLISDLNKLGIMAVYGGNIISDAKAFEAMVDNGQVVLIEKTNVSRYNAVEKELTLCYEQGVNVLGAVVFE